MAEIDLSAFPDAKPGTGGNEKEFQGWYAEQSGKLGLNPNPDDPRHFYDWRAAHAAGATPDESGHWPSKYKREGHPRMVVDGVNTKTGEKVTDTQSGLDLSMIPDAKPRPGQALYEAHDASAGMDPDQASKVMDFSQKTGIDPKFVQQRPDLQRAAVDAPSIDLDAYAERHPAAARFLSDPQQYAKAKDDLESLGKAERTLSAWGKRQKDIPVVGWWLDKGAQAADYLWSGPEDRESSAGRAYRSFNVGVIQPTAGTLDFIDRSLGIESVRPWANKLNDIIKEVAVKDPTLTENLINGAGSMASFMAQTLATGGAAAWVGAAPKIAQALALSTSVVSEAMSEGGNVARQVIEEGGTPSAASAAGMRTALWNLPLIAVTNKLGWLAESGGGLFARMGMSGLMEGTQEGVQQIIQDVSAKIGVGPEDIKFGQMMDAIDPGRVFESFFIGAVLGGGAGGFTGQAGLEQLQPQQQQADAVVKQGIEGMQAAADAKADAQAFSGQLEAVLGESQLAQRDVKAFEQFLDEATQTYNLPEQVYIPARQFATAFQTAQDAGMAPMDIEALMDEAEIPMDKFREAVRLDLPVGIPTSLLPSIIQTPAWEGVKDSLSFSPADLESLDLPNLDTLMQSTPKVATEEANRFKDELVNVAGYPTDQAQTIAALAEARANRWAADTGMAPADWFQKKGLRVEKPGGPPVIPGVEPSGQQTLFQGAYHGSRYKFDKFTLDHVGTGEGAQAQGFGLYFSSKKSIADFYRQKQARSAIDGLDKVPAEIADQYDGVSRKTLKDSAHSWLSWKRDAPAADIQTMKKFLEDDPDNIDSRLGLMVINGEITEGTGQLYKVDIPEDSELLDWNKPLSEQPPNIVSALEKAIQQFPQLSELIGNTKLSGREVYGQLAKEIYKRDALTFRRESARATSELLNSLGIKGITYTGRSSNSRNYVIFDDSTIEIQKTFYQSAFHGSPYKFDKFTLDHIGKGEGAQAYGYGLYFAGKKEVAEWYRNQLTSGELLTVRKNGKIVAQGDSISNELLDAYKFIEMGKSRASFPHLVARTAKQIADQNASGLPGAEQYNEKVKNLIDEYVDASFAYERPPGQLYEVEIPEDDTLLDWDKPLSEQPDAVQVALRDAGVASYDREAGKKFTDDLAAALTSTDAVTQSMFNDLFEKSKGNQNYNGNDLYFRLASKLGSQKDASEYLGSLGIKGIKYLDGSSRNKGEGSHNYVIFDDNAINIIKTYYQGADKPKGYTRFNQDNKAVFGFLEAKDVSTAIHEIGHLLRRDLQDLAEDTHAPIKVREDWKAITEWLGVQPEQEELTREQEEMFARGFEAYIMEGKAPAPALARAFERLRSWLVEIYQNLRNLNVNVTPEVREVFDRLLATDQEIREVQAETVKPHWDIRIEGAPEGMDPLAWKQYRQMAQNALDSAAAAIQAKEMGERRRLEKEWRTEASAQAKKHPGQVLIRQVMDAGGLNIEELGQDFDAETIMMLRRKRPGMVKKTGVNPSVLAAQMGMDLDSLVEAIKAAPTQKQLIDQYVKAQLNEWAGSWIPSDAAITSEYLDFLDQEELLLSGGAKMLSPEFIRNRARESVGKARVQSILEDREAYKTAQAKAEREIKDARKEGSKEGKMQERARGERIAAEASQRRREAAAARKERAEAREYLAKTARYFKRVAKSKSIAPDYLDQIRQLLASYDPAVRTQKTLAKRESLREFVEKKKAAGEAINIPDRVMDKAYQTSFTEMTMDEIRELRGAVENLQHLGKTKAVLLANKRRRGIAQAVTEMTDNIYANKEVKHRKTFEQATGEKGWLTKLADAARGFKSDLLKMEFIAYGLDGFKEGGPVYSYIFEPFKLAEDRSLKLGAEVQKNLDKAFSQVPKNIRRQWSRKRYAIPKSSISLTREQMIMVGLNSGNKGNWTALREGFKPQGWSDETIQYVLDQLTPEEWSVIQDTWTTINSLFPLLDDAHMLLTGNHLTKVIGHEVTAKNLPGPILGQYFPLKFDPGLSWKAERQQLEETGDIAGMFKNFYYPPSMAKGFTVERKGGKLPVLLNTNVITKHIHDTVLFATHAAAFRDVMILSKQPAFRQAVEDTMGREVYKQILPWMQAIARPQQSPDTYGEAIVGHVRRNTTMVMLGLKATVSAKQFLSFSQTIDKVGFKAASEGLGRFFSHPWETIEFVNSRSEAMRQRRNAWDREIKAVMDQSKPGIKSSRQKMGAVFMWPIGLMDAIATYPSWIAGYTKGLKEFGWSEEKAINYADRVVRTTQPTARIKDLAKIQRGSEYQKAMTMFYTFFSIQFNHLWSRSAAWKEGKITSMQLARSYMWSVILPAYLAQLIVDYEPPDATGLAKSLVNYVSGGIPYLRDIVNSITTGYDYSVSPATEFGKTVARVAKSVTAEDIDPVKMAKGAIEVGGYVFGIPSKQAVITLQGILDLANDETDNPLRLIFPEKKEKK
jgi:hypothetical protein